MIPRRIQLRRTKGWRNHPVMAERQGCLDDLAAHGLTPAAYGFERGLRSFPDLR